MIDYNDEYCSFHVDQISVTFSDGVTFNNTTTTTNTTTSSNLSDLVTITSTPTTPLGYEWKMTFFNKDADDGNNNEHQHHRRRIIRLYVITPTQDWRRIIPPPSPTTTSKTTPTSVGYSWKLNSAWMSDEEYDWLHWNVEGYINSQIQVPVSRPREDFKEEEEEEEEEELKQEEQMEVVEQQQQQHQLDNGIQNDGDDDDIFDKIWTIVVQYYYRYLNVMKWYFILNRLI